MTRLNKYSLLPLILMEIAGCSKAETLSDVRPARFDLQNGNIDWKNGIADLVRERCASCHAQRRGRFVPDSTPLLDFTLESEFLSVRNRSLQRIQDASNPMPPAYSDPLSNEERQALMSYLISATERN